MQNKKKPAQKQPSHKKKRANNNPDNLKFRKAG
jgi:hypothetical protein